MIILNSSPVIHLTVALGGLDALPALYGRVLVPEPVLRELEAGAELDDTARRLRFFSELGGRLATQGKRELEQIVVVDTAGGTQPEDQRP